MKTPIKYFILLIFFGSPLLAENPVVIETKVIDKTFNVNADADLKIANRYGNISMTTWDKNTVDIHIEIKVDGKDSEEVKRRIQGITVDFAGTASSVSALTKIAEIKGRNKTNITINYTVKLPISNNIFIDNRYGNIYLDELKGNSTIDLEYGSMVLGNLRSPLNTWELDYVSSSTVNYVNSAHVEADYSKLDINKVDVLNLNADYTDVKIENAGDIINEMDYGNLFITSARRVSHNADYSNLKIGILQHSLVSTGDYGAIAIEKVKNDFEKININLSYSDLSMGIESSAGYILKGEFEYGGLKFPTNLNMTKQIEKSVYSYYEGKAGNGKGRIDIQLTYGSAKIKTI